MREIKFRAWFPKKMEMKMIDLDEQLHDVTEWSVAERDGYIMQYTGLLDKNGKEIYEGDCFSVNNPTTKTRYGVCWVVYNHSFGRYELEDNIQDGEFDFNYFARNGKIIGNIYENPELLKDHAKK